MGVFPCVGLSFRTDTTVLPQSLTRDTPPHRRMPLQMARNRLTVR
jgi:hypothetical protein